MACETCGLEDCEHGGIYCQYCDRGCDEVEIKHVCSTLGVICQDCDDNGENEDYWEGEDNV